MILFFRNDDWCTVVGNNGGQIWEASHFDLDNIFLVLVRKSYISFSFVHLDPCFEVFCRIVYRRRSSGKILYKIIITMSSDKNHRNIDNFMKLGDQC